MSLPPMDELQPYAVVYQLQKPRTEPKQWNIERVNGTITTTDKKDVAQAAKQSIIDFVNANKKDYPEACYVDNGVVFSFGRPWCDRVGIKWISH